MHAREQFRLLPGARTPGDPKGAFVALADQIMRRDRVCLVRALQTAADENPEAFAAYCCAFGRRELP
jgi:hypothetical protein